MRLQLMSLVVFMTGVCVATPALAGNYSVNADNKKDAYTKAWRKYCKGGYCEGYSASIKINGDTGIAYINGKRRKIRFNLIKNSGSSWRVSVKGQQG